MGTHGTGPFDNDGAMDFLAELRPARSRVGALLLQLLNDNDPQSVVVAAEVVSQTFAWHMLGRRPSPAKLPSELYAWLGTPAASGIPFDLAQIAIAALRRVKGQTRSMGWFTPTDARAWDHTITRLIRTLEQHLRDWNGTKKRWQRKRRGKR
jgi:Domain of unknown function (DUF4259)